MSDGLIVSPATVTDADYEAPGQEVYPRLWKHDLGTLPPGVSGIKCHWGHAGLFLVRRLGQNYESWVECPVCHRTLIG